MTKYFYHILQRINSNFDHFYKNNIEVFSVMLTILGVIFGYKFNIGLEISIILLIVNLVIIFLLRNAQNIRNISICFVFLFGFNLYTIVYNDFKKLEYFKLPKDGKYFVYGKVEKINYSNGIKVLLNNVQIENDIIPSKILLKLNQDVKIGDVIGVYSYLFKPGKIFLLGGFNYDEYLYKNNISANGYAIDNIDKIKVAKNNTQNNISNYIYDEFSQKNGAIVEALVLGNKSSIDRKYYQKIIDLGLAHILAISGMHIGFIMAFVYFILRFGIVFIFNKYSFDINVKNFSMVIALVFACLYVYISQFQISAIRSFFMASVLVIGILLGRKAISFSKLVFVFLIMVLYNPLYIFNVSFQLSFIAVTILILYYENYVEKQNIFTYFKGIIQTSLIITIFMFPIISHYWGQIQILGVVTNLVVIPLVGFIVLPLSLISVAMNHIGFDFNFNYFVNIGINILYWFIDLFDNIEYKKIGVPFISAKYLIGFYILMFVFYKYKFNSNFRILVGFSSILLLLYPMIYKNDEMQILVNKNNYIIVDDKTKIYTNIKNSKNLFLKEYKKIYGYGKQVVNFEDSLNCLNNLKCEFKINNKNIFIYNSTKNIDIENICKAFDIIIIPKIVVKRCKSSVVDKSIMYWEKNYIYLI